MPPKPDAAVSVQSPWYNLGGARTDSGWQVSREKVPEVGTRYRETVTGQF